MSANGAPAKPQPPRTKKFVVETVSESSSYEAITCELARELEIQLAHARLRFCKLHQDTWYVISAKDFASEAETWPLPFEGEDWEPMCVAHKFVERLKSMEPEEVTVANESARGEGQARGYTMTIYEMGPRTRKVRFVELRPAWVTPDQVDAEKGGICVRR